MNKKSFLTRLLAIVGTLFVWVPILTPIIFSVIGLIQTGTFQFDYLMPAELFPLVLVGGGLMLWAALRVKLWHKLIAWGLAAAVILLGASQGVAVGTGLASGDITATGIWWALALTAIVAYDLVVIAVGVGGILLLRDLYKK